MSLVCEVVKREKSRMEYMLNAYTLRLKELSRGTITIKSVGDKTYYYLKYRENGKVISKYIKENDKKELEQQIEERRHIESMIKSLRQELAIADKVLGVKK